MIFILIRKEQKHLVIKEKCSICSESILKPYIPMKEWNIEGTLCGKCYSKKIAEYYPGEHIRTSKED